MILFHGWSMRKLIENVTKRMSSIADDRFPCNKKKVIQNIFMHELVPVDSEWRKSEAAFRQEHNFCIQPDRNLTWCKLPMGCYQVRYAMPHRNVTERNVSRRIHCFRTVKIQGEFIRRFTTFQPSIPSEYWLNFN